MDKEKSLTLKTLTKGMAWELQENDVFRLWEAAEKDADLKDNFRHYSDVIRSAFELEEVKIDKPEVIKKYEARGFKVGKLSSGEGEKDKKWAIKKRPISRVTDLTYENIRHISAAKLLEVIDRNFGGGWDSLSQAIRDIIESGFDISTTTLPKDRLRNPGGIYETKVADGFEVLEIAKGTWVEAIFAKIKPVAEKMKPVDPEDIKGKRKRGSSDDDDDDDDDDVDLPDDNYDDMDDDDSLDEDLLEEESYRTTFEVEDGDLTLDDVEEESDDNY